jgi:hypothetical protein
MCLNETYNRVRRGKHLSNSFPVTTAFQLCKVQETQMGVKLNETHQLLAYADDMNLLGDNIDTISKNAVSLIDASKKDGLEINV